MSVLEWINISYLLFLIYYFFVRRYTLAKKEFRCLRCGKCCCKYLVNLSKEDIKKIKKAGYKDFIAKNGYLKKKNGYCIFLKLDKGEACCGIQNSAKPEICKTFPISSGLFGKRFDPRCTAFRPHKKDNFC